MRSAVSRYFALGLIALSLLGTGCGPGDSASRSSQPVVVFAAASTTNALDEIREQFQQETGLVVKASYAASSMLAQQIAHGAGADLFVSANVKWVDYLQGSEAGQRRTGLRGQPNGKSQIPNPQSPIPHPNALVAKRRDLLGNRLVIIVPADSQLHLQKPQDLLGKAVRRLAMADYAAVPAGIYAREALEKLGLWEQLKEKVVTAADVRYALSYVETGAAEAGLVYATDAAISDAVRVVAEIPAGLTEPICYPIVLLKQGLGKAGAESFYRYLLSPKAAEVFRRHGFVVRAEK
jgi:molybdate transport system substrate-binding protein